MCDSALTCLSLDGNLTLEGAEFVRQNWLLRRTRHTKRFVRRYIYIENSIVYSFKKVKFQAAKLDLAEATGHWDIRGCKITLRKEGNYQYVWSVIAPVCKKLFCGNSSPNLVSCAAGSLKHLQPFLGMSEGCLFPPASAAPKDRSKNQGQPSSKSVLLRHIAVEEIWFASQDLKTAQEWVSLMHRVATFGSLYASFLYEPRLNKSLCRGLPWYLWPLGWLPHKYDAAFTNDPANSSVLEVLIKGAQGLSVLPNTYIYAIVEFEGSLFPCLLCARDEIALSRNDISKKTANKNTRTFTNKNILATSSLLLKNSPNVLFANLSSSSPCTFSSTCHHSHSTISGVTATSSSEANTIQRWWTRLGTPQRPSFVTLNYLWNHVLRIPVIAGSQEHLYVHLYTRDDYYIGTATIPHYKFGTQSHSVGCFNVSSTDFLSSHPQQKSVKSLHTLNDSTKGSSCATLCVSVCFPRRAVSYFQQVKALNNETNYFHNTSGFPTAELMLQLKRTGKIKEKIQSFLDGLNDVFEFKCLSWSFFWLFYSCGVCIWFPQKVIFFIIMPILVITVLNHPLASSVISQMILDFPILCMFVHYKTLLKFFDESKLNPYELLESLMHLSSGKCEKNLAAGLSNNCVFLDQKMNQENSSLRGSTSFCSTSLCLHANREDTMQSSKQENESMNRKEKCANVDRCTLIEKLSTHFCKHGSYYPFLAVFRQPNLILSCALDFLLISIYGGLREFATFNTAKEDQVFFFFCSKMLKNTFPNNANDLANVRGLLLCNNDINKLHLKQNLNCNNELKKSLSFERTIHTKFDVTNNEIFENNERRVEVWENERRYLNSGFCAKFLLPIERRKWSTADGLSMLQPSREKKWKIDVNSHTDENGWSYAFSWGASWRKKCSPWSLVRRRCWVSHIDCCGNERSSTGKEDVSFLMKSCVKTAARSWSGGGSRSLDVAAVKAEFPKSCGRGERLLARHDNEEDEEQLQPCGLKEDSGDSRVMSACCSNVFNESSRYDNVKTNAHNNDVTLDAIKSLAVLSESVSCMNRKICKDSAATTSNLSRDSEVQRRTSSEDFCKNVELHEKKELSAKDRKPSFSSDTESFRVKKKMTNNTEAAAVHTSSSRFKVEDFAYSLLNGKYGISSTYNRLTLVMKGGLSDVKKSIRDKMSGRDIKEKRKKEEQKCGGGSPEIFGLQAGGKTPGDFECIPPGNEIRLLRYCESSKIERNNKIKEREKAGKTAEAPFQLSTKSSVHVVKDSEINEVSEKDKKDKKRKQKNESYKKQGLELDFLSDCVSSRPVFSNQKKLHEVTNRNNINANPILCFSNDVDINSNSCHSHNNTCNTSHNDCNCTEVLSAGSHSSKKTKNITTRKGFFSCSSNSHKNNELLSTDSKAFSSSLTTASEWLYYVASNFLNFSAPLSMNAPDGISVAPMLLERSCSFCDSFSYNNIENFNFNNSAEHKERLEGIIVNAQRKCLNKVRTKNQFNEKIVHFKSMWKDEFSKSKNDTYSLNHEEMFDFSEGESDFEVEIKNKDKFPSTNERQGFLSLYRNVRKHIVKIVIILSEWNSWIEKLFNIFFWKDTSITTIAVVFLTLILLGAAIIDLRWLVVARVLLLFYRGYRRGLWKHICRACAVRHIRCIMSELKINKAFAYFDSLEREQFRICLHRRCRVVLTTQIFQEITDEYELAEWVCQQRPEFSKFPKSAKNDWIINFVNNTPSNEEY